MVIERLHCIHDCLYKCFRIYSRESIACEQDIFCSKMLFGPVFFCINTYIFIAFCVTPIVQKQATAL